MLETIGLVVAQLSAVYAALLASFLCVFVPQSCPPSEQFSGRHECTVRENTHAPLSLFNQAALAINCWTLLVVGIGLSLVAYRENFLIKFFEVEEGLPSNALQEEIRLYPELQARLTRLNNLCYTFLCVVVVSMFVNLIISAVFILAGTSACKCAACIHSHPADACARLHGQEQYDWSGFVHAPALPACHDVAHHGPQSRVRHSLGVLFWQSPPCQ